MAKKIIVLEKLDNDLSFKCAFWATVPAARIALYANAIASSQYKNASAPEIAALQDGSIVEKVETFNYAPGTALSVIQSDVIAKFNDFQSYITNFNPFVQYGRFWDGSSWTAGGVA